MSENSFMLKTVILLMAWSTADALSLLRVTCDDSSQGAEIYINGVPKGQCPRDIGLKAGGIKFRAVLKVDADHERVFEKNIHLYDRSPDRVEVQLSSSRLTAKAKKAKASASLLKARNGDIKEMQNISTYYKEGMGLVQSSKKAEFWRNKATEAISQNKREKEEKIAKEVLSKAEAGNIQAMDKISKLYAEGKGVKQDTFESQKWKDKASSERALKKHTAEVKKATETLTSAEAGDISSMKKIAGFYQSGTGVEQSGAKSQEWFKRAELRTQEKNKEIKQKRISKELDNLKLFYLFEDFRHRMLDYDGGNKFSEFTQFLTISPALIVGDLISSPTYTMEKKRLEEELSVRAARFKNSDSMIAKAYNKKLGIENVHNQRLISAR
ncbi:MAG: hypothetical protein COA44_04125 [Arcobacter sp.]|nr:MAG: hypothetical protein COA44_04125 [Arcobacter sp.]